MQVEKRVSEMGNALSPLPFHEFCHCIMLSKCSCQSLVFSSRQYGLLRPTSQRHRSLSPPPPPPTRRVRPSSLLSSDKSHPVPSIKPSLRSVGRRGIHPLGRQTPTPRERALARSLLHIAVEHGNQIDHILLQKRGGGTDADAIAISLNWKRDAATTSR